MRIIAGKYRGKKLKEFDIDTTRPTQDRVKESIFNLIQFDIQGAVVLDLFAGTGALGIECISRGARRTYLVDNNPRAISLINDNLKTISGDFKVIKSDFMTFLKGVNHKFDIILLDPPFDSGYGEKAIDFIINNDLISDSGIIIFETHFTNDFDSAKYTAFDTVKKKYGTVAVYKMVKKGN